MVALFSFIEHIPFIPVWTDFRYKNSDVILLLTTAKDVPSHTKKD